MPKLILDVMGGDRGPHANLEGAAQALSELQGFSGELVLLGDENVIRPLLAKRRHRILAEAQSESAGFRVRIVHAPEAIDMEDSIRAIRRKPNATINVGCQMAAESYASLSSANPLEPAAFISAGHSGAMMASALLHMGRLPGVDRPAIAARLPTLNPNGCVLLDVGANVDCKPEHLRDFSIMGSLFAQLQTKDGSLPRIGILSNGEEASKGNDLTRASLELIVKLNCFIRPGGPRESDTIGEFIGNVEGKEIFKGQVDVVVMDGFVGNVVLKSVEGLGSAVVTMLKQEAKRSFVLAPIGMAFLAPVFTRLKKKLDYAEYGAAPLLGVSGYAFICHGRSNSRAIKNALMHAHSALRARLVERLEKALAGSLATENPGKNKSL